MRKQDRQCPYNVQMYRDSPC